MNRAHLDHRDWNTANSHGDLERRITPPDVTDHRQDRNLTIAYWAVVVGMLVAGVIGIISTPQIVGIG